MEGDNFTTAHNNSSERSLKHSSSQRYTRLVQMEVLKAL